MTTNTLFLRALAQGAGTGPASVRIIGCRSGWALGYASLLRAVGAKAVTHDPDGAELRADLGDD